MSRAAVDTRLPLSALMSQAFVAFTIECDNEFEHRMPHRTTRFGSTPGATRPPWLISMAMWEHCLRHVPADGISARELAVERPERRGRVVVGTSPRSGRARVATLSADGVRARAAYQQVAAEIERGWGRRCGRVVGAVREPLEILAGDSASPDSPLLAGLTPYPEGWRAQVSAPQTLPHYPFVSHRGGFPDGS